MCGLNNCQILTMVFRLLIGFSYHDRSTKTAIYLKVNEDLLENEIFCLLIITLLMTVQEITYEREIT